MKGCTSARLRTSLEPSKPRPELVSPGWVSLSQLSYLSAPKYILKTMASTQKLTAALKYFHIFLLLLHIYTSFLPAEPPLLAQGAPVISTGIGQSLSIPCMLLDGIPLPERHWSRNGKPVRLTSNLQIHAAKHTYNLNVPAWQQPFFSCTGSAEWEDVREEWWQFIRRKSRPRGRWDVCLHCGECSRLHEHHSQAGGPR